MQPQTCPLCGQRRARRACPALGRSICASCCGTKRLVEIRCPADCGYLTTARAHPPASVQRQQERDLRFLLPLVHDLTELQSRLFFGVQAVLRTVADAMPSLIDRDLIDATEALASTYETATRGVIYEHRPTSLPAQRLVAEIRGQLEQLGGQGQSTLRDQDLAVVMRRIERAAREARKSDAGDDRAFLGLIRRMMADPTAAGATAPDAGSSAGARSGLVIP